MKTIILLCLLRLPMSKKNLQAVPVLSGNMVIWQQLFFCF